MKYIRTKNGIWLFGGTHFKGDVIIGRKQEIDFGFCFDKKDVIKQADTIEELCDEFRGIWIDYYKDESDAHEEYHYDSRTNEFFDDFEELTPKEAIEKFDMFYGAIWTDKGLIYVAKMNEKGELELL